MPSIYAAYPYKNLLPAPEPDPNSYSGHPQASMRALPNVVAASSKAELEHRLKEWPATEWKVYWRQLTTTKADIVELVTNARRVMEQGKLVYVRVNEKGGIKTWEPPAQGVLEPITTGRTMVVDVAEGAEPSTFNYDPGEPENSPPNYTNKGGDF